MTRQLFAFRGFANPKKDRETFRQSKVNQDRDAWAMHLLVDALQPKFDIVVPGFNIASLDLQEEPVKSRLRKGDLVLTSTRFGLNDLEDRVKTPVLLSNNWLEEQILAGWEPYVKHCSRKRVYLTEKGSTALNDPHQFANLNFADTDDASFGSRRTRGPSTEGGYSRGRHSAGYIIYIKELWSGGPSCLSIFGLSGTMTFGFASTLHERWRSELASLRESELVFVELCCERGLTPIRAQGFPDYWRSWTLRVHRNGTVTQLPPSLPRTYAATMVRASAF